MEQINLASARSRALLLLHTEAASSSHFAAKVSDRPWNQKLLKNNYAADGLSGRQLQPISFRV